MPTGTYNLIDQPCVPVRWKPDSTASGTGTFPDLVGLRELLLRSHEIESLAVADAPAHAALLRVLYALTARVANLTEQGPEVDWDERRLEVLDVGRLPPGEIEAYFEEFKSRFFLFAPGGRPWMQDPRLAQQCDATNTAGVNKLIVTRPSGNNHSWFRHDTDNAPVLPTAPEAFLSLLVWNYYGPSGRCSSREVNGVKSASATAGPLRTALSYHPEGDSLFETLLAGLVPPDESVNGQEDLCPWEQDDLPDPDRPQRESRGPRSRHTGRSQHALLLLPDEDSTYVRDAFITWAYRERMPREDDYLIWQTSQQGNRYPRPADSGRALWRDLDALLLHHPPAGSAHPQQPRVFRTAVEVCEGRVRALGFDQEGQAKDTQFVDASTPLSWVTPRTTTRAPSRPSDGCGSSVKCTDAGWTVPSSGPGPPMSGMRRRTVPPGGRRPRPATGRARKPSSGRGFGCWTALVTWPTAASTRQPPAGRSYVWPRRRTTR